MEDRLRELRYEKFRFEFGNYFSEAWKVYSRGIGSFIGFGVLLLIFFFFLFMINLLLIGVTVDIADPAGVGAFGIIILLGTTFLVNTLFAGIMIYAYRILSRKESFNHFFHGFRYAGKLLLYALVTSVLYFIPMATLISLESSGDSGILGLLVYGWVFVVNTAYFLALPLMVISDLSFWKAMELSRVLMSRHFLPAFGYVFLASLILVSGFFLCWIGMIFTLPFYCCLQFAVFNGIVRPEIDQQLDVRIEEFGSEENDINTESQE